MSSTCATRHFSLPCYSGGQPPQAARQHLLVTQFGARPTLNQTAIPSSAHLDLAQFANLEQLSQALAERLGHAEVGVFLELQGDEAFIWSLHKVAREAGLLCEEILLKRTAPGQRLLFCVHCATLQTGTDAAIQPCANCAVVLQVRQHFSVRLGAYLGVCADAEHPYEQARS
jgi:hypothetical protein